MVSNEHALELARLLPKGRKNFTNDTNKIDNTKNMKTILVTGSAGFIGSNLVLRLFKEMSEGTIVGLDNLNV